MGFKRLKTLGLLTKASVVDVFPMIKHLLKSRCNIMILNSQLLGNREKRPRVQAQPQLHSNF